MHITTGSVTSLIDTLERKGFVIRIDDPNDRRKVLLDTTPAAQDVLDNVLPAIQQRVRSIFESISDTEIATLRTLLSKVAAGVAAPQPTPPPTKRHRPKGLDRHGAG